VKWKLGVEGVQKAIAELSANGLDAEEIKSHLPLWQKQFGFSKLALISKKEEWDIEGEMSPGATVSKIPKLTINAFESAVGLKPLDYSSGFVTYSTMYDPRFSQKMQVRQTRVAGHIEDIKAGAGRASHISAGRLQGSGPNDHGGHLIGDRFFGRGDRTNVVPMHGTTVNLSLVPSLIENPIARWANDKSDKDIPWLVYIDAQAQYDDSQTDFKFLRPTAFTYHAQGITGRLGAGGAIIQETEEVVPAQSFANPL
jgi:hypothetical protein